MQLWLNQLTVWFLAVAIYSLPVMGALHFEHDHDHHGHAHDNEHDHGEEPVDQGDCALCVFMATPLDLVDSSVRPALAMPPSNFAVIPTEAAADAAPILRPRSRAPPSA